MRRTSLATLLSTVLGSTGCGGGGSASSPPVTVAILSTDTLDGTVGAAGDFTVSGLVVQAGDSVTNEGYRGFVSFDLGTIPAGATVLSATLRLVQSDVLGAPYASMGTVSVDQVVYGAVLDPGAYSRSFPFHQAFATLSSDAILGAKTADATAPVQLDVENGNPQSQFRLRFTFESDADAAFDLANFYSGSAANSVDVRPTLTVTYKP